MSDETKNPEAAAIETYHRLLYKHFGPPEEMLRRSGNLETYQEEMKAAQRAFNEEWFEYLRRRVVVKDGVIGWKTDES